MAQPKSTTSSQGKLPKELKMKLKQEKKLREKRQSAGQEEEEEEQEKQQQEQHNDDDSADSSDVMPTFEELKSFLQEKILELGETENELQRTQDELQIIRHQCLEFKQRALRQEGISKNLKDERDQLAKSNHDLQDKLTKITAKHDEVVEKFKRWWKLIKQEQKRDPASPPPPPPVDVDGLKFIGEVREVRACALSPPHLKNNENTNKGEINSTSPVAIHPSDADVPKVTPPQQSPQPPPIDSQGSETQFDPPRYEMTKRDEEKSTDKSFEPVEHSVFPKETGATTKSLSPTLPSTKNKAMTPDLHHTAVPQVSNKKSARTFQILDINSPESNKLNPRNLDKQLSKTTTTPASHDRKANPSSLVTPQIDTKQSLSSSDSDDSGEFQRVRRDKNVTTISRIPEATDPENAATSVPDSLKRGKTGGPQETTSMAMPKGNVNGTTDKENRRVSQRNSANNGSSDNSHHKKADKDQIQTTSRRAWDPSSYARALSSKEKPTFAGQKRASTLDHSKLYSSTKKQREQRQKSPPRVQRHNTLAITEKISPPASTFDYGSDDNDKPDYKYEEVVRGKAARAQLLGHSCPHCDQFWDVICKGNNMFKRQHLEDCSRHRSRHSQHHTPEGFWDLSFQDEKRARQKKQV